MTEAKKRSTRGVWLKILRLTALSLLCLVLGLTAGVYLLCRFKQDYVVALAQKELRARTNLPFTLRGPVMPVLRPRPGIRLGSLRLAAADMSLEHQVPVGSPLLSLERLEVTVNPLAFLFKNGHLLDIVLRSPLVTLAYTADGTPLWVVPEDHAQPPQPGKPEFNLNRDIWNLTLPLRIENGALRLLDADGNETLGIRGLQAELNPDDSLYPMRLNADLHLLNEELDMAFTLDLGPTAHGDKLNIARGRFTGGLRLTPPGSRTLHADLFSSMFLQKDGRLALPDMQIAAEGDHLTLHLLVDPAAPSCTGKMLIHSISLPRWFMFGRNLPPGLQAALHKVGGSAHVSVTDKGAALSHLNLTAGDLPVNGLVACKDFQKPVVLVDLALPAADLDAIFPFLALPDSTLPAPEEPRFDHPPLVPYPEAPGAPAAPENGLPDVGYDVRVAVAKPVVHALPAGPVLVKVFPKDDLTRVSFDCDDLLKGALDGYLDIAHNNVVMHYQVNNAELAPLPENKDSNVRFEGRVTGTARMDIPVAKDGSWSDTWKFRAEAKADNLKVLVAGAGAGPWHLLSRRADLSMDGVIHTARTKGISLDGLWKLNAQAVAPSWNPKGSDALQAELQGRLSWPPFVPVVEHGRRTARRGGLESVAGGLKAQGVLRVPLGSRLVPVSGTLSGVLDWKVDGETLSFDKASLDGLGSYFAGDVDVDMRGRQTVVTADTNFKLNPAVFLKEWQMLPGGGAKVPANVSGTSHIQAQGDTVEFGDLNLQIDGSPATGRVLFAPVSPKTPDERLWTIRLDARRLDLDNYFPPVRPDETARPRSTEQWDLSPLQGFNLDTQITAQSARLRKLLLGSARFSAALNRNRFTVAFCSDKFYDGAAMVHLQGSLDPAQGRVNVNTANLEMKSVSLGKALTDALEDPSKSYGGTASLSAVASGAMSNEREMYSGMSGNWSMSIKDGIYPAFIGSETAGLRNTFDSASASGPIDKGVLLWKNFKLSGTMVDMSGDGKLDLGARDMDFTVYVTLAKVPTVPVRFYGSFGSPSMSVRGAHMVVHTAKAAGVTVFDIFRGVLELPGRAVMGVGDLFQEKKPAPQPTAPLRSN